MAYKHLIVHLDGGERAAERLDLAARLAQRWGARLTGLFAEGQAWGPRLKPGRPRQGYAKALKAAAARFDARVREAGVEHDWWRVADREMDVGGIAARYCRYADLAILGQHDPEDERAPADLASQVLLESGRPVLLVPSVGHYPDTGRRVVIAWNGSREAARAVNDALPLVGERAQVLVVDLRTRRTATSRQELQQADIVAHLKAHGIEAGRERVLLEAGRDRDNGVDVLNTVLNAAADFGADLVVMGARGRHGVPFPRPGRQTRDTLRSMVAPVLLSL
jgi:nucleotide-binding universal stress UspA family protein